MVRQALAGIVADVGIVNQLWRSSRPPSTFRLCFSCSQMSAAIWSRVHSPSGRRTRASQSEW